MVYKEPENLYPKKLGACDRDHKKARMIAVGVQIVQKPLKPTKRRGRVAAEPMIGVPVFKPLPQLLGPKIADSKKKSSPAYSMAKRTTLRYQNFLEGPAKYNLCGMCKTGPQVAPAYSLKSRSADLKKYIGPGPSGYDIKESYEAAHKGVPKYTFGKRPIPLKFLPTPAANVYFLPPIFGTSKEGKIPAAPAFSLLGREKPRNIPLFVLPGPGQYEDYSKRFAKTAPKYSMHIKHKIITDEHLKPGPGAHCPELYMKHKSVPAPSLSILHSPYLGVRKAYIMPDCKRPPKVPQWIM